MAVIVTVTFFKTSIIDSLNGDLDLTSLGNFNITNVKYYNIDESLDILT